LTHQAAKNVPYMNILREENAEEKNIDRQIAKDQSVESLEASQS
jgi:hypothetical protein